MRKVRVILIVTSLARAGGGVAEVVRLTAGALEHRDDIEVQIATFSNDLDSEMADSATCPIYVCRPAPPRKLGFSPSLFLHLQRQQPDVIHVHGIWELHTAVVLIWALLNRRPYIVSPHGMLEPWIRARSYWRKLFANALYHTRFLRGAYAFQALTKAEIHDVTVTIQNAQCRLIPNFVPDPETRQIEAPNWWRDTLEGKTIYLYFGRIHQKKGCIELLEAWARACERAATLQGNAMLVFAGWNDGLSSFDAKLQHVAQSYQNVIFVGPQYGDDRRRTIGASHFVVLPSHSEGLPMVVLEAWAAGRPVLMSAKCNLPQGFAQGAAREIRTDVHGLSEDILTAQSMTLGDRATMSINAINLATSEFSTKAVCDSLVQLYKDAAKDNMSK